MEFEFDSNKIKNVTPQRKRSAKKKGTLMEKASSAFVIMIMLGLLIIYIGWNVFTVTIPAGHVGVVFDPLSGGVKEAEFGEGLHIKWPWVSVQKYSVRTQDYTISIVQGEGARAAPDEIQAITEDGMTVWFDLTVLYMIDGAKADVIHQTIGPNYGDVIIRPQIRTAVRDIAAKYDAAETHIVRPQIAEEISEILQPVLAEKNIIIDKVLVRHIKRPQIYENAIDEKLEQQQRALKMEYVLLEADKERERKIIEAEGISEANKIIGKSLSSNYLTWYWIENLNSHESVIYVPVGDAGIPLFKEITEE